jgi:hypothetical protein
MTTSAGQVTLVPVHASAGSHDPVEARQTVVLDSNVHVAVQHSPPSHSSPAPTMPSPQNAQRH